MFVGECWRAGARRRSARRGESWSAPHSLAPAARIPKSSNPTADPPSQAAMAAPNPGGIPIKAEHDSEGSAQSTADMTAFVQNLLVQMQTRFQTMSENIIAKIDEMGARIDELEMSINDLKTEMGSEGMTPTKPKDEESKPADSSA